MESGIATIDFSRLKAEEQIVQFIADYPKASKIFAAIRKNEELRALWDVCNYIALKKLLYSDHGPIHGFVAARNALVILNLLKKSRILPDLVKDQRGDWDDVALVIMTAALFHDVGNAIHRELHWLTGPIIFQRALDEELRKIYPIEKATFLKVYIFNIIYAHEYITKKVTMEASIVGLGDYTDMTRGRAVGVLGEGKYNIHTVSALAIERVLITPGQKKPIRISVELSNSAGIFHVEEALVKNLLSGTLKDYVEIIAEVVPRGRKTEKKIVTKIDALEQNQMEYRFHL
jgi:metal-dependent HD superfamily phosphatase/phosphodiesterase